MSNTVPIPKRPEINDEAVVLAAAKRLAPKVNEWADGNPDEIEQTIKDLVEAIGDNIYDLDGYRLSQHLDRNVGYSADSALVEILDSAGFYLHDEHKSAVQEWVKVNSITVPFKIADKVVVKRKWEKPVDGTIYAIITPRAEVIVNCPSLGHNPIGSTEVGTKGIVVPVEQCVGC